MIAISKLRTAIMTGDLPPGSRIVEEAVARQLGVSRTPLREALYKLEAERLVSRLGRDGVFVTSLSTKDIEDHYAVRAVLEGLSARTAALTFLPRDWARLDHVQKRLEQAYELADFDEMTRLNFRFHDIILETTRNDLLIDQLTSVNNSIRRLASHTIGYPGRAKEAIDQHRALMKAIDERDCEAAERLAREHMECAMKIRLMMNVEAESS